MLLAMTTRIAEASTIGAAASNGGKYRARLIQAGQGSSGFYEKSMLDQYGAAAFPAGTPILANHTDMFASMNGGDVQKFMGKTITAAESIGPDEQDGLYATIQFSEAFTPFIKEFQDILGLSIEASGVKEDKEIDGEIKETVVKLFSKAEAPYNAVSVVQAPGANGRLISTLESASKDLAEHMNISEQSHFAEALVEHKASGNPADETNEGIEMTEEELKRALAESQTATVSAVQALLAESLPKAEVPSEAPKLEVVAEAIVSAGLTEGGRAAVYEKVELGVDYARAIESEKAREESIRKELGAKEDKTTEGVVFGESNGYVNKDVLELDDSLEAFITKGRA